jgi:hypothetical protein
VIFAAALLAAAPAPPATLSFVNGNALYLECQKASSLACLFFIFGVSDTLANASDARAMPGNPPSLKGRG